MQNVMARIAVSVSELKKSPSAVVGGANGAPVAVLKHNRVVACMAPTDTFEAILERLGDQTLAEIARAARAGGPTVRSRRMNYELELSDEALKN